MIQDKTKAVELLCQALRVNNSILAAHKFYSESNNNVLISDIIKSVKCRIKTKKQGNKITASIFFKDMTSGITVVDSINLITSLD